MLATARWNRLGLIVAALAVSLSAADRAVAQNIQWANLGSDWTVPSNWVGGVIPLPADSGFFIPNSLTPGFNPFIPGSTTQAIQNVLIGNAPLLTNYTFTSGSSGGLALSGNAINGSLTTRGIGTTTFDGPVLSGNNTFLMNVGTSTVLRLTGSSAISSNQGNITINGGTLQLDNTGTNIPARILNTAGTTLTINGSGKLQFFGNTAGTTTNAPALAANSNNVGGVNVIEVNSDGAAATLNFANSGSFTLRPGTRGIYQFVTSTGNLGDTTGARVTFTGTPFLGANGLLGNSAGGGTVGFAIATDIGGTNFATWNSTNGIIRATATQTGTTAANLQSYAATDRVQYNQVAATETASATITNGSLRINPGASGQTLALGAFNLATNALMIDGFDDFTISGNAASTFGATGTRYIYVNGATQTLTVNGLQVASGSNPTVFAGPGFLNLTGSASQNTLTTTTRFILGGGTVRGNNTQIGFTSAGVGIISIVGGVLEIKNGSNGVGASADFTRALGAAAGNVTWGGGTSAEQGSGGFSAFGSNASVNIGGAASPTNLQWGATNFVGDGYALIFGSTQSNAQLSFLNPLQLDNGTTYQAREIRVINGVGGDGTVMAGTISGAANADLIKTGQGTLVLPTGTTHTYQGTTFVPEGTLQVDGTINAGSNAVIVGIQGKSNQGTLAGIGTVNRKVIVQPTGTISPGTVTPVQNPGILTVNGSVTMSGPGSKMNFQIQSGTTPGNGAGFHSQLVVTGGSAIDLANASLLLDFNNATYTPTLADRIVLIDYSSGPGSLTGTFSGLADGSVAATDVLNSGLNYFIFYGTLAGYANKVVLAPVPEPLHILLVGAAGAAGYGWIRRRRAKVRWRRLNSSFGLRKPFAGNR